jgi:hypothetical protein
VTYHADERNRLSLFAMYGHSRTEEDEADNPIDFSIEKYNTATTGVTWRHLWGDSGYSDTALSWSSLRGGEDIWRTQGHIPLFTYYYDTGWLSLRKVTDLQLSGSHHLKLGFEVQRTTFRYFSDYDPVEKNLAGTFGAFFAGWTWYPFSNLSFTGGLRLDYFPFSRRGRLSPRLSFAWRIGRRLTLTGAYGRFVQQIPLFLMSQYGDNRRLRDPQARNLYGLVSFTYFRAGYRDLMGAWRNRLFDHRHILCVSGGYKPDKYWEFSLLWIWSGNKAFTPVNENASLRYGYPRVDYGAIMSGHLLDYQSLSARVDRRFFWRKTNLVLYAGALNALNRDNEVYRQWIPSLRGYESEHMWGIIPYVGLEFEF